MSDAAVRARSARQGWARAGSSHDRLIGLLRIALPVAIFALAVLLAVAPVIGGRDISFVLAKDRVEVAHERMRVAKAIYRGQDQKGEPFRLRAGSAVQVSSRDPVVRLAELDGDITLPQGPATIDANTGRYDMDTQQIAIDGPVKVRSGFGYRLDTRDVTIDMNTRKIASGGAVDGAMTLGTFRADRLFSDLEQSTVDLVGGVHLRITQTGGKAQR